jgi:hypothetical protein
VDDAPCEVLTIVFGDVSCDHMNWIEPAQNNVRYQCFAKGAMNFRVYCNSKIPLVNDVIVLLNQSVCLKSVATDLVLHFMLIDISKVKLSL